MISYKGVSPSEVRHVPADREARGNLQGASQGDLARGRSAPGPKPGEVPPPPTRKGFVGQNGRILDYAHRLEELMIGMPRFVSPAKELVRGIVEATEQPIPPTGDLLIVEAEHVATYLRERVLRELYLELEMERIRHGTDWAFLGWTTNGVDVDTARCEPYSRPNRHEPRKPLIMRLSVNNLHMFETEDPDWRYELMGSMERRPSKRGLRLRTEVSVLPHEVLSYVPFVARLIEADASDDPSRVVEPPPGTRFFGEGEERFKYLWSEAAWSRIERFHETERIRKERRTRAS